MSWDLLDAVTLCKKIEDVAPGFGYHVALTGGCLYRSGERADVDLIFYRYRQADKKGLLEALDGLGIQDLRGSGWRYVGYVRGCSPVESTRDKVDVLFPEERAI